MNTPRAVAHDVDGEALKAAVPAATHVQPRIVAEGFSVCDTI